LESKSASAPSLDRPVAILTSFVYFVQGAIGLSGVALPLLLRQKGWSVSQISTFAFITGLPWTLKLFYGALTDGLPLWGKRRQPYVILSSLISVGSWLGFAFFHRDTFLIYALALAANLGFALTDVVTDALVVERSTEGNAQLYQSLSWGFRGAGAVLGGVVGGWLAENVAYRWIFALTALLPITTLAAALFIEESHMSHVARGSSSIVEPVIRSLRALFRGDLKWFSGLLVVGSFSTAFSTPFFFHLKEGLRLNEAFLGSLSSITWLGAIAGCLFYGRFLKTVSLRRMLGWSVALNVLGTLSAYLIIGRVSAVVLSLAGGVVGYLSFLPLIAAAAFLARQKGIEGSLFALLMSVNNLGQLLSTYIGGKLFDIIGLNRLIGVSALVALTGFFFVKQMKVNLKN